MKQACSFRTRALVSKSSLNRIEFTLNTIHAITIGQRHMHLNTSFTSFRRLAPCKGRSKARIESVVATLNSQSGCVLISFGSNAL